MHLAVPFDSRQDYMLAMVVHQQILTAGMAHSIEFHQMVEAVQLEIPAKVLKYSERVHSIEKVPQRGNKEPMRLHLASMKKRLLLLHSAHEKLFHHEDGSEHAHFPREEEFHLLKKSEYFPLTAGQLAVEPHKRSSSQGESLHRSKTRL